MNLGQVVLAVSVAVSTFVPVQTVSAKEKVSYPTRICGAEGSDSFLMISGFKNYPPFSWSELDEDIYKTTGFKQYKYNGFILDSVKSALKGIHVDKIKGVFFDDYQQMQKAVLHGKTDILFTGYYVDEAKSGADYVYPAYFGNPFIVVSRASKKIDVNDVSGLKGLKGVLRREEEIESLIEEIKNKEN